MLIIVTITHLVSVKNVYYEVFAAVFFHFFCHCQCVINLSLKIVSTDFDKESTLAAVKLGPIITTAIQSAPDWRF